MVTINSKEINDKIASLPSRDLLSKELQRQEDIAAINDYALQNPTRVFDKDFTKQRLYLTEETWKAVILANPDMLDSASLKWRHIPNADIVNKYQGQAFSGEVRKAINEDGVKVAGLAAAVPGTIIGGGALAKPVLSLMFYHPGTFFAETIGGTIGGLAGGAATDAITRGVSDYDSFANMIASNSTIPELYAEMLNPGMLLGGLAGGIGGNVLYNNVVKPAALRAALPYLMTRLLNKNVNNTTLSIPGMRYFTKTTTLPGRYQYTLYNNNGSQAGRLAVQSPEVAGTKGVHIEMVNKIGNNTGVSEDLYNVAVKDAINTGYPGVESGENLLSAPITKHVTLKFPHNKELIGIPLVTKNPITGQYEFKPVVEGRMLTGTTNKPLAILIPEEHIITNYNPAETVPQSNTSTSLKFYERPSTLTEAERLGIPKGERNLPYVEGYRKRHPEDIVVNVEKEKKQIIDLFNKPIYRDRLLADGYTELEIDDFVKNQILFLDRLKKAPAAISKNVPSDANGIALVDHIRLHHYDPEVALHEFGHLSEYPTFFFDNLLPKITKTSLIYGGPYYKEPGEVRTRALGVLLWLDQHGTTLDDFYKIVSDRAHSDKWWSTLNERAKEFLFAYPEDLGRNYLLHFRKQGGIINYLNLFK